MADIHLPAATNAADLPPLTFRVRDAETGDLLDLTGAAITVVLSPEAGGTPLASMSTADGRVTVTEPGVFVVALPADVMRSLEPGVYALAAVMERGGEVRQIFLARLPVKEGYVR